VRHGRAGADRHDDRESKTRPRRPVLESQSVRPAQAARGESREGVEAVNLAIVSLCVNDEHGFETGHVCSAHFSTDERGYDTMPVLELESPYLFVPDLDDEEDENPHLKFVAGDRGVLIAGDVFPIVNSRAHVGNVHWNGYAMLPETARRLAKYLLEQGWTIDALTNGQPFIEAER
jgi:hypothetical protein